MSDFIVLFQNSDYIVVDKPAGYFVHRPEAVDQRRFCPPDKIILQRLRDQIRQKLFPVHRLDVATSGVLVFGLSSAAAHHFCTAIQNGAVQKTYQLLCRGWIAPEGEIDIPLALDSTGDMVAAKTTFRRLARFETPGPANYRFPHVRYSFVEAHPVTGRFHQIRRHFNRIAHPILGDCDHGDSRQNRFFRERFGIPGLCLRATQIDFPQMNGERCTVSAPVSKDWQKFNELLPSLNG